MGQAGVFPRLFEQAFMVRERCFERESNSFVKSPAINKKAVCREHAEEARSIRVD